LRFAKPLDATLLHDVFKRYANIITIEDGCLQGGMGSAILEFMADHNYKANVVRLGIPDEFIEHGEQPELWTLCGYDKSAIITAVKKIAVSRTTKTMAS
jgi:1-deoxy-D-xylulose-5-phosphate synthase